MAGAAFLILYMVLGRPFLIPGFDYDSFAFPSNNPKPGPSEKDALVRSMRFLAFERQSGNTFANTKAVASP